MSLSVFDTVDPPEDVTCLCHLLGQAYLMMFDGQKTWKESKKLLDGSINTKDFTPSQEIKKNTIWTYNQKMDKNEIKTLCGGFYASYFCDWINDWERSLHIKGCFSSKALTCSCEIIFFFGMYFWYCGVLQASIDWWNEMMHLQQLRIIAHDTCGNLLLSEYFTITVDTFHSLN